MAWPVIHPCRGGAVALLLGALSFSGVEAEPLRLAPDQMRAAAAGAMQNGQSAQAVEFADALITRDPGDVTAHLIRAGALRDMGQTDAAKDAARKAWSLAETPEERYSTALIMAQALSSADQRTRAQLWLRRAIHEAPNERLSKKAINDFRYVRATNPWSTRLSFAITPESNINNGSSERSSFLNYEATQILFGQPVEYVLDGAALALSGLEYQLGAETRYRFSQTGTRAHDLTASVDLRFYSLSSEAKSLAPTASGSDFTFLSYSFGYGHRGINFDRKGEYRLSVETGQSWYGGDEYARFLRLAAGQTYKASATTQLGTRWAVERQFGISTDDIDTLRASFSASQRLDSGAWISLLLTGAVTDSPNLDQEFDELGVRAQYALAEPVLGANVIFGLGLRSRDYDVSRHSRDGREDTRTDADITFIFKDLDYYGFIPTMTISASQTDSNIGLYNSDRFGVNFGIQSAF